MKSPKAQSSVRTLQVCCFLTRLWPRRWCFLRMPLHSELSASRPNINNKQTTTMQQTRRWQIQQDYKPGEKYNGDMNLKRCRRQTHESAVQRETCENDTYIPAAVDRLCSLPFHTSPLEKKSRRTVEEPTNPSCDAMFGIPLPVEPRPVSGRSPRRSVLCIRHLVLTPDHLVLAARAGAA